MNNLCKFIVGAGGTLTPLLVSSSDLKGPGLMNPSIYKDGDDIFVNLRNINYVLYHSEVDQKFNNRWGPLVYMNPENDITLTTYNIVCKLNSDLSIDNYNYVDTSKLDVKPLWEFIGLEDARLFKWNDKIYLCGVRRDTTTNGEGRMELSEIEIKDTGVKEVSRVRIQPPFPGSYCEKNWMPVLDLPYHFVKWTNLTEVVKVNPETGVSEQAYLSTTLIPDMPDFRGGSQVIPWKDYRICVVHQVNLYNNVLGQKDGKYRHRFIVWDKEWNIVGISDPFSFLGAQIEFACGVALDKEDLLISFGFQDNASFVLRIPESIVEKTINYKHVNIDQYV